MSEQDDRQPSEMVPMQAAQYIVCAMVAGVLMFSAIAAFQTWGRQRQLDVIVYVGMALTAVALVGSVVAPPVTGNALLRKLRAQNKNVAVPELYMVFLTRLIIRSAILEGVAFLCVIAYIVSANWWLLGLAGFLAAAIAAGFPTRQGFDSWIHDQLELLSLDQS